MSDPFVGNVQESLGEPWDIVLACTIVPYEMNIGNTLFLVLSVRFTYTKTES